MLCLIGDQTKYDGRLLPDRQRAYNLILRLVRVTIVAVEKVLSVTYCECLSVALVIQRQKRMLRIILSSVAPLASPHFSTLFHKQCNFGKEFLNINRVFRFSIQIWSETFLILRRIQRDFIINVKTSSCKVPVIHSKKNSARYCHKCT